MKNNSFSVIISLALLIGTSCGMIQTPAPQPMPSATENPPRATAMSELPPTWTTAPTFTPSATIPASPTPLPTQDPENYQIGLALTPITVDYPEDPGNRSNWTTLEGQTATMDIPPSYEELDFAGIFMELMFGVVEAFAEGLTEMALEMGEEMGVTPEAEITSPEIGEMPEFDFVIAMEEVSQSAIFLVSVDKTPTTTTEDLINQALSDAEIDFIPISWEEFLGGPFPMERVLLDVVDDELGPGKQIIYVIIGDQYAWNVVFSTPVDQFEKNLPLYESAVASFAEIKQ